MKRFWKFIESLIPEPRQAKYSYILVPENHEFRFRSLCPYCAADMVYTVTGWEQDDNGLWSADCLEPECVKEPDIIEQPEDWNQWCIEHSHSSYVYQMAVDLAVKEFINETHRFYFLS